jgi:hypothetical protein
MNITLHLKDSSMPHWPSAYQVYRPELSTFILSHERQSIDHIDVVATWKGLSVSQAKDLCWLQTCFKQAIERIVEDALITRLEIEGISIRHEEGGVLLLFLRLCLPLLI